MTDHQSLKKTILYDRHLALKARIGPFGGYAMPIQYTGIFAEHQAARQEAVVFDTCHMGEFKIAGPTAVVELERLLSCRIADLPLRKCRYCLLCNQAGGVIDDLLVYRLADQAFMLVVNAATRERDWQWLSQHLTANLELTDQSAITAKIDLQGPASPLIALQLLGPSIKDMTFYSFTYKQYRGHPILISRTGYTGEIGFELYCPPELATELWDDCLAQGAKPAGLGARDTLRLEMGMPLYGHELSESRNAAEAGLKRAIAQDKYFIGSENIQNRQPARKLVGIALTARRAARAGNPVLSADGSRQVGLVTSGSFAPSLGHAIALAYLDYEASGTGTPVLIAGGRRNLPGQLVEPPFYRQATGRAKLQSFLEPDRLSGN